jgi:hypothetical protein
LTQSGPDVPRTSGPKFCTQKRPSLKLYRKENNKRHRQRKFNRRRLTGDVSIKIMEGWGDVVGKKKEGTYDK